MLTTTSGKLPTRRIEPESRSMSERLWRSELRKGGVKSARREAAAVRRKRDRIDLAAVFRPDRQADDPLQLAFGQRPHSHGLVVGRCRHATAGSIDADAPDLRGVHPGFDAQERRLVRAGLDRRVERRARRAVDRALVTASVGQTPLQRKDLFAGVSSRVVGQRRRRFGGKGRQQTQRRCATCRPDQPPDNPPRSSHASLPIRPDEETTPRRDGNASATVRHGPPKFGRPPRLDRRTVVGVIEARGARIGSLRDGSRGNLTKDFLVFRIRASILLVRFNSLASRSHECSRPPYYRLDRVG